MFNQLLAVLGWDAGLHGMCCVSVKEQLAIFLHHVHYGLSNYALQEHFHRSADIILKYVFLYFLIVIRINAYLNLYIQFSMHSLAKDIYCAYVQLPPDDSPFPELVLGTGTQRNFLPYFYECFGALNGTHLLGFTPKLLHTAYRNRKGEVTQNVLMACTLDMRIVYILSGWEGSVSNSCIFEDTWSTDFWVPMRWYYLGNAGYADLDAVLVPYWNMQYYIKEWGSVDSRCMIAVLPSSIYSDISCLNLKITKNYTIFDMHSFGM